MKDLPGVLGQAIDGEDLPLSDIAENAVSFSYRLCMLEHYLITEYVHLSYGYSIVSPALIKRC